MSPAFAPPAVAPAPGTKSGSAPTGATAPAQAPLSFMRSTRAQSTFVSTIVAPAVLGAAQIVLPFLQIRPQGYLRALRLNVAAPTSGNGATVAFQNDAPWNVLQNVILSSPGSDVYLGPIDGFALFAIHKYACMASDYREPLAYPSNQKVVGVGGGTGGTFVFEVDIPVEIDARNAYGSLQNQNGAEMFNLQLTLGTAASVYSTLPTTAPIVTITVEMDFYSQPAKANLAGRPQATAPIGNGTYSLIQSQIINPIGPGSVGRQQVINTGTLLRGIILIFRTPALVRTEADIPSTSNLYLGGQQLFYKLYTLWRNQINEEYGLTAVPAAVPAAYTPDNGVVIFTDWMDAGGEGSKVAGSSQDRARWLPTGRGTLLEYEPTSGMGAGIGQLQIITLGVKPIDADSTYALHVN